MRYGSTASGPGFIGGNVSQGANKGTGAGVPNLLMILRGANNEPLRMTYTDANGDYSFGNIPTGTYTVYPEEVNYLTTPSAGINAGSAAVTAVDFKQTATEIKPVSQSVAYVAASAPFSIAPNPAAAMLRVSHKETGTIQLLDVAGRTLSSLSVSGAGTVAVDISSFPSGLYYVQMTSETGRHTEKLIVQH
jgi:hypothetical protein